MFAKLTLTKSYVIVFLLLVFWSGLAFTIMQHQLDQEHKFFELINKTGKQRMYSQKLALTLLRYQKTPTREINKEIKSLITSMHQNQFEIESKLDVKHIATFYKESLTPDVHRYHWLIRQAIQKSTIEDSVTLPIIEQSKHLLTQLEHAVTLVEEQSHQQNIELQRYELMIFLLTLLTLTLEALYIIRPVVRQYDQEVKDKNQQLIIFEKIFNSSIEGIMITDHTAKIVNVNPAFTDITGYNLEQVLGSTPRFLNSGKQPPEFYEEFWRTLYQKGFWQGDFINRKLNGRLFYQTSSINTITNENGEIEYYVSIFQETTEQRQRDEELKFLALHDPLTRLPNYTNFMSQITSQCDEHPNRELLLAIITIDSFINTNQTLGHNIGDKVLHKFAKRLSKHIESHEGIVAKMSGGEFMIAYPVAYNEIINEITELYERLSKPLKLKTYTIYQTISIGAAHSKHSSECNELVTLATSALEQAKQDNDSSWQLFSNELHTQVQLNNLIEIDLKHELQGDKKSFFVHFQPIVDPVSKKMVGVESLVRWNKTIMETVMRPDLFITIAERKNLVHLIDLFVLQSVVERISMTINPSHYFSINVSAHSLLSPSFAKTITKVPNPVAKWIVIELTETSLINDIEQTESFLQLLVSRGFRIALDDFGTGYSSLMYLSKLSIHYLKIDQTFVRDLANESNQKLVKTIVAMSKSFGFMIIAEGVESKEQIEFLNDLDVDYHQGFYYAKPTKYEELTHL
jgi:diguanylate cyclase (GGDEF)-like protein/PAS domain S-box-containing protein